MGQIDVTDMLADPDMVDRVQIVRRQSAKDTYGENVLTEFKIPTHGSVQPASGKALARLPEAFRVINVMSFWVRGEIVSDGTSKYPDQIIFRGNRYNVQAIFDWTNWGSGWCEGTCIKERIV